MTKQEPKPQTVEPMEVEGIPEDDVQLMDTEEYTPDMFAGKISLIAGDPNDLTAATYQFTDEDHTLGNALRWVIAKDPKVEYVGYSIPHPSEPKMNFRIQTIGKDTREALDDGLTNLIDMCEHVSKAFQTEFKRGDFKVLPNERDEVNKKVAEMLAAKKKI
ncbi:RNA polymerase subunit AC19 [Entomophthora muscae]|uniref:RNA polymerase subunit AC19 n=1 Tax=Entomophthora muscae TaxID=34485 RepID=A0ACC2T279_9FUNG|nr:RNA polymerase subunit AC19 [Entomophthora muscae]